MKYILMVGMMILYQRQTAFPLLGIIAILTGLLIWRW